MKAPEKNHILIAFIGLILLLLAGWVYVEVAFSEDRLVTKFPLGLMKGDKKIFDMTWLPDIETVEIKWEKETWRITNKLCSEVPVPEKGYCIDISNPNFIEIIGKNGHFRIYENGKIEKLTWKEISQNEDVKPWYQYPILPKGSLSDWPAFTYDGLLLTK